MAGKHSKNFFEKKDKNVVFASKQNGYLKELSLPFKLIVSIVSLALCVSLVLVGAYFLPGKAHTALLLEAKSVFESGSTYRAGLKALSDKNNDIKAWLKIEGTNIDYAVCQCDNDTFYINHNQNGKKSRYGALFLSSQDSFARNGDKNIVIYGNNMKDGTMFGSLKKYRNINFYKQNPSIKLYCNSSEENYLIFSVMLIGSSENSQNIYNPSKSYFIDQGEFNAWYNETLERSLINTTVTANQEDEFLTLVTPADDFDGARLVVIAKKSSEREISQTDVTKAGVNPQIKYPEAWYISRGMEYPY